VPVYSVEELGADDFRMFQSFGCHYHPTTTSIISCCIITDSGSAFWYQLTGIVIKYWPLNECSSQLGQAACKKSGVGLLVVTIWSIARLTAPVVTTTYVILSSNTTG